MTNIEFSKWLLCHKQAFPGVGDWLRKNPDTVGHWETALSDVDFDAAKEATSEMLRGDLETPRGYSEHVRTVRQRAREIIYADVRANTQPRIDGEDVFNCPLCRDKGTVLVLDPSQGGRALVEWAGTDRSGPRPACKTSMVLCECSAGNIQAARYQNRHNQQPRNVDRYDKQRHFRCEYQWPDVDELLRWLETRYSWNDW